MKLKYYLRGMGVGIILTAIIMGIALKGRKEQLSDAEIMARARELGMIDATVLSDYAAQDGFGDALGGLGENGNAADGSAGESVRSVSQSSSSENPRVVFEPIDPMQDASAVNGSGSVTTGGDGGTASTGASSATSSLTASTAGTSASGAASSLRSSAAVSSGMSSSKTSSDTSSVSTGASTGSSISASSNAQTASSVSASAAASGTGASKSTSQTASTAASSAASSASSAASTASAAASTAVSTTAQTEETASTAASTQAQAPAPASVETQDNSAAAQESASGKSIVIPGGVGSETVAAILEREGLIDSASAFDKYLCDNRMDRVLRSGTKTIPEGADWEQIAAILTR